MSPPAFDRRVTPARPDLAAAHLRGTIEAARFAEGVAKRIVAPNAPLRRAPDASVSFDTEALHGEEAIVYEEGRDWAWVQLTRDHYVGYLPLRALGDAPSPTHRVAAVRTHAYPGPSIKTPPRFALSLGALIAIERWEGDFAVAADGAHYYARHLAPIDSAEADFVAVAEKFLEAPYLWGGRTWEGLDCSGLAQTALTAAGRPSPRDTDMMEAALGKPLAVDAPLQRGDLVFWKGHVGIMRDSATLLHANGWHMKVVSETLEQATARIADKGGGAVTSIRRLDDL
jgi:cell wall-associated NlpC family hydrolase